MTADGSSGRNPCVFVVGCPRSGTTLLQRMLDAHPQLAVANDTHFIGHAIEAVAPEWRDDRSLLASRAPELIAWSRSYHRFARLGLPGDVVDGVAAGARDFPHFVAGLYDALAREHGKPFAGDKTPSYVRRIPLLDELFPRARFVHLMRDGRDVALSLLGWATPSKGPGRLPMWSEDAIAVCALWWSERVAAGRRDGGAVGTGRCLEVSYEDLVGDPARELRRVTELLDLPFADDMLAFNRGKERARPGRSAKQAWLGPTAGLRDWRRQLQPEDVQVFELLAGDTLAAAGYATGESGPASTRARERAARAGDAWQRYWADRASRHVGAALGAADRVSSVRARRAQRSP